MLSNLAQHLANATSTAQRQFESIKAKAEQLNDFSVADYELKPFDVVLFAGSDPAANFIKKVTLHEVVPNVKLPFTELWTHSGILVDKTVLPLDFLEDGKMYLYESVFSGEVAGYVYSKVLPLDHAVPPRGFHLGPQIRDFAAVVEEGDSDVGICRLSDTHRQTINQVMAANPNFLLDLYNYYKDFSYPITNILPVIASASERLYSDLQKFRDALSNFFPKSRQAPQQNKAIFCSELVATIFQNFGLPTFVELKPDTFTPLEVEVSPEMERKIVFAKINKVSNLLPGNKLNTGNFITEAQKLMKSFCLHDEWVSVAPGGGVPPNATPAGAETDGAPLYIARCRIGNSFYLGKIGQGWKNPVVTLFNREVSINFGHEVLVNLDGMVWVPAKNGQVPAKRAVKAGMDDNGEYLYIARGEVAGSMAPFVGGFRKLVCPCGGNVGEKSLAPGVVSPNDKAAVIPYGGSAVKVSKYEVLCYKTF
ncbi:hypothetical protein CcCBS67573_g04841 [Chytriomyces confervae]|uniref:Uncharacterized protein n=1 Tax=Chytriomyces confervae TaxID=246404 RepID=A0A507FCG0_9FUNG|nr:hypothetical protein HDU80_007313 [Chytriomyces hyalinus]TPX73894.1 hypothetical protein CcCBS67573_g04841 [Chytriomyces confervae]